jgi:hypothetical protein
VPSLSSPPFRRVRRSLPVVDWTLADGEGNYRPWADTLPDWDPAATIRPAVQVTIQRDQIVEESGVGLDPKLRLGLCWHSRGSQVRGDGGSMLLQRPEAPGEPETHTLTCAVPGGELASSVDFRVVLALESPGERSTPLSAQRAGSVLWDEERRIRLEGAGGRFPMVWTDFERDLPSSRDAAWHLDWDPAALDEDVFRGPCLWLNRSHPRVREAVENPGAEGSRDIIEMIHFDVGRSLIVGALRNEDFVRSPEDFSSGSVGWAVAALIRSAFPGIDVSELASRMREAPVRFEYELQHGLRFLQALA